MADQLKLSVIIPAFNEAGNLKSGTLDQVSDYLKDQSYSYEVIIVDDGSTDKTTQLIREIIKNKSKFRLIENPHGGKAITVMTGMLEAKGEVILFTDMDQATPINEIENFFPKFNQGFDIVIGSRHGRKGAPLVRRISAQGFSTLRNLILGLPFADTQCGFKAFDKRAVDLIIPQMLSRWKKIKSSGAAVNAGFDIELLYLARKKELKITEVLVDWRYVESERVPFLRNATEALKDMFRIRFNDLKGQY